MQAHVLQVQLQQHVLFVKGNSDEPTKRWHARHRSCTVQEAWHRSNMLEGCVCFRLLVSAVTSDDPVAL